MASLFSISAVAALVLSATAPVSAAAAYGNGTFVSPYQPNNASIEVEFCAEASGKIIIADHTETAFLVVCGEIAVGTAFFPSISPSNYTKRAYEAPQSLAACLTICGESDGCVAANFDKATFTCAYLSDFTGVITNQDNFAYGVETSLDSTPYGAGDDVPSVVYAPYTSTVYSCAATVTNCPLRAVVTDYYPVTTTICPATAATSVPVTPIACSGCAYTASAIAVVSPTTVTVSGVASTSYATVSSATVNIPLVSNYAITSTLGAATASGSSAGIVTGTVKVQAASASASASASGPEAFTGGAASKAGFGAAAVLAGAAMIL